MSWSWPPLTLWFTAPAVLTFQAALQQYRCSSLTRVSCLPICIWLIYTATNAFFEPKKPFLIFNVVIHISKIWSVLRSIELAVESPESHTWIGYDAAYASKKSREAFTVPPKGIPQVLHYAWADVANLRGIGWEWGIKGTEIPSTHPSDSDIHFVASLLLRIVWSHALSLAGVRGAILARRSGGPALLLQSFLKPHNASKTPPIPIHILGNALNVLAFGAAVYATLEAGYTCLTLVVYLFSSLLSCFSSSIRFEKRAWPRLMNPPYTATSLHSFWGKKWHALFRRQFLIDGYVPLSWLAGKVGAGKNGQRALGVMAAFAISGIMHEVFNDATPWLPRDPYYRTFLFFFLQSIGLILESAFRKLTKFGTRSAASTYSQIFGWIWTFGFLLCTGKLMGDTWMQRGLGDFFPPLDDWEWWRWVVPFGFIFPRLT